MCYDAAKLKAFEALLPVRDARYLDDYGYTLQVGKSSSAGVEFARLMNAQADVWMAGHFTLSTWWGRLNEGTICELRLEEARRV